MPSPFTRLVLAALMAAGASLAQATATVTTPAEVGGEFNVKVVSLKEARFRSTVRQQYDFSCGSAAVATLLSMQYHQPVSEQDVFREMFQRGDRAKIKAQGFSMLDMKHYLDAHGYQGEGLVTNVDKLAAAGIPVIVLLKDNGYNHFVVVKGIRDSRVLLGDPSRGTRAVSRAAFEAMWPNRLALMAREHRELATFNQDNEWRAVPTAPLEAGLGRDFLDPMTIMRGPADF